MQFISVMAKLIFLAAITLVFIVNKISYIIDQTTVKPLCMALSQIGSMKSIK